MSEPQGHIIVGVPILIGLLIFVIGVVLRLGEGFIILMFGVMAVVCVIGLLCFPNKDSEAEK